MKKVTTFLFILFAALAGNAFSQTAPAADFFAGKWEISLTETPAGDVKFRTDLVRKDGKLTGELSDVADASKPARLINSVEETADQIIIYFTSSQGDELPLQLAKVDNDNLKGRLMDSFEATAKRMK